MNALCYAVLWQKTGVLSEDGWVIDTTAVRGLIDIEVVCMYMHHMKSRVRYMCVCVFASKQYRIG